MALASNEDIETSLTRRLTPAEAEYTDRLLERVEARLLARLPGLLADCEASEHLRLVVIEIESEAVARVLRAEGAIYSTETEGGYSYAMNSAVAGAALRITPEEWGRLTSTLGSISPATDGYLATRRGGIPPEYSLQCEWPARVYPSELL